MNAITSTVNAAGTALYAALPAIQMSLQTAALSAFSLLAMSYAAIRYLSTPVSLGPITGEQEALDRIQEAIRAQAEELDLSGLGLKELPPMIQELKQLKTLNLSRNRFDECPEQLAAFENLTSLNLSRNRLGGKTSGDKALSAQTKRLSGLKNLTELDLSGNQLRSIHPSLGGLEKLRLFKLSRNKELKDLPVELLKLNNKCLISLFGCHGDMEPTIIWKREKYEWVRQGHHKPEELGAKLRERDHSSGQGPILIIAPSPSAHRDFLFFTSQESA